MKNLIMETTNMKNTVIKIIFFALFSFIAISCNTKEKSKRINFLENENDSLKNILKELEGKYIFDSIAFRDIYSKKNTNKLNSELEIELLVVGFNSNQTFFTKFDSINKEGDIINPVSLKQKNGGFKYKTKLRSNRNSINIDMNINSKYGKSKTGRLHDVIIISK
ncbi:hypothetical protein [Tenacibaculum soleae]|uniref:hypothetical protein n=1 Tax=Tenacibaculum soleae TaxID=447689 RepID=UPI0026E22AEF|nr:hypothetical protein [Tenacibaculum soleae]MDO6813262.1 hypothetical protein [Tenacibaculum soleae]